MNARNSPRDPLDPRRRIAPAVLNPIRVDLHPDLPQKMIQQDLQPDLPIESGQFMTVIVISDAESPTPGISPPPR